MRSDHLHGMQSCMCGKWVALNRLGRFRRHYHTTPIGTRLCPSSGSVPTKHEPDVVRLLDA